MDARSFLNNFETIIESPGGIERLREFILFLAVRGKLVEQFVEDGKTLTEITKYKLGKKTWENREEVFPWSIPANWTWVSFSDVADFSVGRTPPTKEPTFWEGSNSISWVSITDLIMRGVVVETNRSVTAKAEKEIFKHVPSPIGTMLMSFKLTIGKVSRLGVPAFFNEAIFSFDTGIVACNEYLFRVLSLLSKSANSKGAIKGSTLNSESISNMRIPLPPLAEQNRIVAKVDELISLCDQFEAHQTRRNGLRYSVRASAIDVISTATSLDELNAAWKRISQNWIILADTPESIVSLRSLILDLAVRGKLIQPNEVTGLSSIDWAVSDLRLDEDRIWSLPTALSKPKTGWSRVPLAKLGHWGSGGTPTASRKDFYQNGSIPWAVIGDLNGGLMTETASKITQKALSESSAKMIPSGSVLVAMYGASIGKVAMTGVECCTNQAIAHCVPDRTLIEGDYLLLLATSLKKHLIGMGKGAAQPNISQTVLKHLLVDIPQVLEQKLILAKVDELMALCDELERNLLARENIAEKYSKSIISTA